MLLRGRMINNELLCYITGGISVHGNGYTMIRRVVLTGMF